MTKKLTYKVVTHISLEALEDIINKHASKGWILDQVVTHNIDSSTIIFRDK